MEGLRGQYQSGVLESFHTIVDHVDRIRSTQAESERIEQSSAVQEAQNRALSERLEAVVGANKLLKEKVIKTSTAAGKNPQQIALMAQKNQALQVVSPYRGAQIRVTVPVAGEEEGGARGACC